MCSNACPLQHHVWAWLATIPNLWSSWRSEAKSGKISDQAENLRWSKPSQSNSNVIQSYQATRLWHGIHQNGPFQYEYHSLLASSRKFKTTPKQKKLEGAKLNRYQSLPVPVTRNDQKLSCLWSVLRQSPPWRPQRRRWSSSPPLLPLPRGLAQATSATSTQAVAARAPGRHWGWGWDLYNRL